MRRTVGDQRRRIDDVTTTPSQRLPGSVTMAIRKNNASDTQPTSTATAESDYGSDIDEETWNAILSQVETQPLHEVAITSIEESQLSENDATEITQARILRVARIEAHLQAGYNELRHLLVDLEGENQRSPSSSPFVQRTGNEGHDSSAVEGRLGVDKEIDVGGADRLTPAIYSRNRERLGRDSI